MKQQIIFVHAFMQFLRFALDLFVMTVIDTTKQTRRAEDVSRAVELHFVQKHQTNASVPAMVVDHQLFPCVSQGQRNKSLGHHEKPALPTKAAWDIIPKGFTRRQQQHNARNDIPDRFGYWQRPSTSTKQFETSVFMIYPFPRLDPRRMAVGMLRVWGASLT